MWKTVRALPLLGILLLGAVQTAAQQEEPSFETRWITLAQQMRMSLTLASIAAHSPTFVDLRLHAQQLVNLLEGPEGRHFVRPSSAHEFFAGLSPELAVLSGRIADSDPAAETRALLATSARNVRTYLDLALAATLDGMARRRMDDAIADMFRAYAFLWAAYETPCEEPSMPGLWTILRTLGLGDRMNAESVS